MGIPDHLTYLLRNLHAGQEATVRTGHGTQWIGSKLGKGYIKAVYCHPGYLTSRQSTSCEMSGWMNHKLDKIAGRNLNNFRYAGDTTLMVECEQKLKSLMMKVREESEKAGLKVNIQKIKIMASGPTTFWQTDVEKVTDFIFLGSKITVDG